MGQKKSEISLYIKYLLSILKNKISRIHIFYKILYIYILIATGVLILIDKILKYVPESRHKLIRIIFNIIILLGGIYILYHYGHTIYDFIIFLLITFQLILHMLHRYDIIHYDDNIQKIINYTFSFIYVLWILLVIYFN
jgi:hypothetical protein